MGFQPMPSTETRNDEEHMAITWEIGRSSRRMHRQDADATSPNPTPTDLLTA